MVRDVFRTFDSKKAYEGARAQGIGRSRGGLTTKVVAVVDAR